MQTEFNLVLQKLSEAGSENIVRQLKEMFLTITKMSDDELVATYQTIDTVGRNLGLASAGLMSLVQDAKKAIEAQMQESIFRQAVSGRATQIRFTAVTNKTFKNSLDLIGR